VHLTTSDPAAHLAETLDGSLEHLTRQPHRPARGHRALPPAGAGHQGRQARRAGRALLEEDLRSPCTEEIAVFQAFSRAIREAGRSSW
jgi:arsenite-transporting ATPase